MSLQTSFQEASSRSFAFLWRSLGAAKKRLQQHLSLNQKSAVDMASLTDADVIEFYTKDILREKRKTSLHGEVPDCFRTNKFFLSIEGQNWVHDGDWKDSCTWAKVYMRNKDSGMKDFHQVLRTEIVVGDRHPRFTARAQFNPLTMENSQNYAMNTTIRIDTFFKETRFASIHVNLAQLLWNMVYETSIELLRPPILTRLPRNKSKVKLLISKGPSAEEEVDDCEIFFNVQMRRSVWKQAQESKLFISISSVAGYGEWSRCYVSELLSKPTKTVGSARFSSFKLNREGLTGDKLQNPVRVEILGMKRGVSTVYGFIHLFLPTSSKKCYVSWNQSRASHLSANVVLHATVSPPNHVAMSLHIGTDEDKAEVCTTIKRHENATGGKERDNKNRDSITTQITQSSDSLGSSSGSSDSSMVSSLGKKKGKALPSGPQYHVRFPSSS